MNCLSKNVIYCIQCKKCQQIYIGQTSRELKTRFSEHKTAVRTFQKNTIGDHFNMPGHSVTQMTIFAIEKVFNPGLQILEKRESMWIRNLEAEFKGLNRKKWSYFNIYIIIYTLKLFQSITWWSFCNKNEMHCAN